MKMSILIPSLNEPESIKYLARLRGILDPQVLKYPGEVEIVVDNAGREIPTGTKRNNLIANSNGDFYSQIDVDDLVPDYYVDEMMKGIEFNPDVISFVGFMTTNGADRREFTIKLGEKYEEREGRYYRYPNHLCCFKRSVVGHIKFRPIWVQEDYFYATEIRDKGLLKSEVHIGDKWLYHYEFISKTQQQSVYSRRKIR